MKVTFERRSGGYSSIQAVVTCAVYELEKALRILDVEQAWTWHDMERGEYGETLCEAGWDNINSDRVWSEEYDCYRDMYKTGRRHWRMRRRGMGYEFREFSEKDAEVSQSDMEISELYSLFPEQLHEKLPSTQDECDIIISKRLWRDVVRPVSNGKGSPYRLTRKDIPYLEGRLREAELGACGDRERTDIGRLHISAQESIRPESIKMLIDKINRLGGVYVMD